MIIAAFPVIIIARRTAEYERNKSLTKNPNKIEAKDVVSSVKVVTFVKFLPVVVLSWILLCYLFVYYYLCHKQVNYYKIVFIGVISFMCYGYISTKIIDQLKFHFEKLKTIFYYFIVPKGFDNLKEMRKNLVVEVNDFLKDSVKDTIYDNNREFYPWNKNLMSVDSL